MARSAALSMVEYQVDMDSPKKSCGSAMHGVSVVIGMSKFM